MRISQDGGIGAFLKTRKNRKIVEVTHNRF